jgi:hypothetical protein
MMSLWDVNGILTIPGNPNSPFVGLDQVRAFLVTTGSFTYLRFSLVLDLGQNLLAMIFGPATP